MHAQTQETAAWWARPRGADNPAWIAQYQGSTKHRHRDQIVAAVKALQPETLLEVGSHCGPNLVRLASEMPKLNMIGIDVNAEAIQAGRNWIAAQGLSSRIQLNAGRIPEVTESLPSQSVDVVLSCYALAYIAPSDLDGVLYELGRLAKKAIVLAEPMGAGEIVRALSGYCEWTHNYQQASRWIATWRGRQITVTPITPPVDRLNAVLVAVSEAIPGSNVPSTSQKKSRSRAA